MDCHVLEGAQCAGAAIYRSNVCKRVINKSLLILPADKNSVFASRAEFLSHHTTAETEPSTPSQNRRTSRSRQL
jgi:hypothetical protein